MIDNHGNNLKLVKMEMQRQFSVGSTYSRSDVKKILKGVYIMLNVDRNPKHYDLQEAFIIKEKTINGDRKVEIVKKI